MRPKTVKVFCPDDEVLANDLLKLLSDRGWEALEPEANSPAPSLCLLHLGDLGRSERRRYADYRSKDGFNVIFSRGGIRETPPYQSVFHGTLHFIRRPIGGAESAWPREWDAFAEWASGERGRDDPVVKWFMEQAQPLSALK